MTKETNPKKTDFEFFKVRMPESRKADFYLGCLDGSVFLDFNYNTSKQIYLRRISFDGYGCCNINNNIQCLNEKSSIDFVNEISKTTLNQKKIKKLVLELIELNKDNIWLDSLEKYNLIDKKTDGKVG